MNTENNDTKQDSKSSPKPAHSERKSTRVKMEMPEYTETIFADGIGPALIGFPYTKFTLYQRRVGIPDDNLSSHNLVKTIQVPTVDIIKLAERIKKTISENESNIMDDVANMLQEIIKD